MKVKIAHTAEKWKDTLYEGTLRSVTVEKNILSKGEI